MASQTCPQYASKGINLACLSQGLLPQKLTYCQIKAGTVTCSGNITQKGWLLFGVLLALHLALLLLPLYSIIWFYRRQRYIPDQRAMKRPEWVLVGMAVFSIASLGEIAQHIHDNWLYFGMSGGWPVLSLYNAIFYGALTTGQACLAWALAVRYDWHIPADMVVSALAVILLIAGSVMGADAEPPYASVLWITVFTCLLCTSVAFGVRCFHSANPDMPCSFNHWPYAVGMALSYGAGIVFAICMSITRQQWYHPPTASGFLIGFLVQTKWLDDLVCSYPRPHHA